MNNLHRPDIVIYTKDPELTQRLTAYLEAHGRVRAVEDFESVLRLRDQLGSLVILMDLRHRECARRLEELAGDRGNSAIIALGHPRSEPMLDAEALRLYACEHLDADRAHIQTLVLRAADYVQALRENEMLRAETQQRPTQPAPDPAPGLAARVPHRVQIRQLSHALRKLEKLDALFDTIIENVAITANVSRVGIFCKTRDSDTYRLRASQRCVEETARLEYRAGEPFLRWLTLHDHIVARATLEHIPSPSDRQLLRHTLDLMGAEALLPLYARGSVIGWLLIGSRATGIPFDHADLEDLTALADHVSTTLENAFLYEEAAIQRTLAETLLHSMPTGIIAVGTNGVVRWFNSAAQQILDMSPNKVLNSPLRALGSRLSDVLQRTLDGAPVEKPTEWIDPVTKRHLSIQTHRLTNGDACHGAVALVQDRTLEMLLEEKREQLERASFWEELAASMSHEVRNPLVAIKTFAQLLPERYEDSEFRTDFSKHVVAEVDRLNNIIEQINHFAHPPHISMTQVNLKDVLFKSLKLAQQRHAPNGTIVDNWIPDDLPGILGDESALAESFAHLIVNALEATEGRPEGRIEISAKKINNGDFKQGVMVTLRDNGKGMALTGADKVFSPFYTTKARGMGLGLPTVKRTIVDHNGKIHLESSPQGGTSIFVLLPAGQNSKKQEKRHETHISR